MRFLFRLMLFFASAAAPVQAQQRVITGDEQAKWHAVGKVAVGGADAASSCSGVLVAPDLVLTAKHCVPGPSASREKITNLVFLAGWNDAQAAASSPARDVMVHPDHVGGPLTVPGVASDVALVRLAQPITSIAPLPLWMAALPERVGFVAYANSRPDSAAQSTGCFNVRRAEQVHYIACGVESGNSGAPVLVDVDGVPHVAGTISARARLGALASTLDPWAIGIITDALQQEPSK